MTKYLVKAKKGCTFVSTNGNGEFLDEYRYRVFSNPFDIREWGSRKALDIYGELRDDATPEKLDQYLKDGEEGLKKFFEEFSISPNKTEPVKKAEPVVVVQEAAIITEEAEEEIKVSSKKKSKHSKK